MRARAVHTCALTCGVEFSLCLGTHRIATSFFVASSPSLGPWRTNCGRLDGGFVPWQCLSEVVLRHSGARCKRRFAGCALWLHMFAAKEQNFKFCNFSTWSLIVTVSQPIMTPNNFHFIQSIDSIPLLNTEMLISETAVINIA